MSTSEAEAKSQSIFNKDIAKRSQPDYKNLAEGLGKDALRRAREVASATGSVLAELPGEFSQEDEADTEAYIKGEIDAHEAAERTVARWHQRAAAAALAKTR